MARRRSTVRSAHGRWQDDDLHHWKRSCNCPSAAADAIRPERGEESYDRRVVAPHPA